MSRTASKYVLAECGIWNIRSTASKYVLIIAQSSALIDGLIHLAVLCDVILMRFLYRIFLDELMPTDARTHN
jgi:hypothetical protein